MSDDQAQPETTPLRYSALLADELTELAQTENPETAETLTEAAASLRRLGAAYADMQPLADAAVAWRDRRTKARSSWLTRVPDNLTPADAALWEAISRYETTHLGAHR